MSGKKGFDGCTCQRVGANCQHCQEMSDKPELKLCPFCGKQPELSNGAVGPIVNCWSADEDCGHRGIMMTLKQWNQRSDLAKPSEWISVSDRLPEHNDIVIIHFWGVVGGAYYNRGNKTWRDLSGKRTNDKITHWMPLPSPPTRETP